MKQQKNKLRQLDCEEAVSRFNSFLDNYLKGILREELMSHLESCKHCLDRLEFEQMIKSRIKKLGSISRIENKKERKKIEKILNNILSHEHH